MQTYPLARAPPDHIPPARGRPGGRRSVETGPQAHRPIAQPVASAGLDDQLADAVEEFRGVVVAAPELAQIGEGPQVGRIGGDPEADVEQPVEVAGAPAPERHRQVVEHALDDRTTRNRVEVALVEGHIGPVDRTEAGEAGVGADAHTGVVGIDEATGIAAFAHEEMAGKADPVELDTEPAADLDQHDRQGDRHADPPPQDLVQVAVAGIVVVVPVADEAMVDEDVANEPFHRGVRAGEGERVERLETGRCRGTPTGAGLGEEEQ